MFVKALLYSFIFISSYSGLCAQVDKNSELFQIIKTNDSLLFTIGFNHCDISQFEKLLSEDFEFYHDISGITATKAGFLASVRDGLCKLPYKARRELAPNSQEVYPLKNNGQLYGAIQQGQHKFYALEKGRAEYLTSAAKFTHLWLLENGQWKLKRGLSYDHREPAAPDSINTALLFTDRAETEKWLKMNHIPALGTGYIQDGKIQSISVYGRREDGQAYADNTIFNVASLTKPVTALVALKLIEAGKWRLDEPLYKYWTDPDIAKDPLRKKMTTRHVLSHTTGLPNWRGDKPLAFSAAPGSRYQYSGEGYEYLRKALEKKFNTTLDKLAATLVFEPLGMVDTRFYWDSSMTEERFAHWYKKDGSRYDTYKNKSAKAADDLLTTVADYTIFMQYIMQGAGLGNELYAEMQREQIRIAPRKYFGLGWWIDEDVAPGSHALLHGGDDIGVHTMAIMLPDKGQALHIFTNCDNGTDAYIPLLLHYLGDAGRQIIDIETK